MTDYSVGCIIATALYGVSSVLADLVQYRG
jgi:hypothetical protein